MLWDRETSARPAGRSSGRTVVPPTSAPPARRRARGPHHRADRAAARPVLLRHQADVAGRARARTRGARGGGVRPLRGRHRRVVPDRADDARHGTSRTCRTPADPALRPVHRRLVRRAVRLFGVPRDALPELVPNWGEIATTDPKTFCDLSLPIAGVAGDQQSALFGQTCFDEGDSKCTYGTGSFILTNTGSTLVRSDAGLLSTAAGARRTGSDLRPEGAIFVTGAAVQWLRDGLQIVGSAAETARSPRRCRTPAGVLRPGADRARRPALGPARAGPDHRPDPRTTRAHVVRATWRRSPSRCATCWRRCPSSDGLTTPLRVDGGASANDLLCQVQADQIGCRSSVRGSWRRRRWARVPRRARRPVGPRPTTSARPGSWTAASTRRPTGPSADAATPAGSRP